MRTTITIEPDVEALLKKAERELHEKPKALINRALREGLPSLAKKKTAAKERFSTRVVSLGACKMANLDNVSEALSIAEGEGFR